MEIVITLVEMRCKVRHKPVVLKCNSYIDTYVNIFIYNQMNNEQEGQSNKIKIDLIVIGNPNSGKTSLIRRFIDGEASFNQFYTPTLGLSLEKKVVRIDQHEVTICIWDTAGQQKFFSLTKNYFKKADGVLIVFDLTDKNSFERIQKFWIQQIKQKSDENCCQILIGNKKDIMNERIVQPNVARQLSERLEVPYFETSAKTGEGVQEAIKVLVKNCLSKVKEQDEGRIVIKSGTEVKRGCFSAPKEFFSELVNKFK